MLCDDKSSTFGVPCFHTNPQNALNFLSPPRVPFCDRMALSCLVRRAVLCVKSPDSRSNASISAAFLLQSGANNKVGKGWTELWVWEIRLSTSQMGAGGAWDTTSGLASGCLALVSKGLFWWLGSQICIWNHPAAGWFGSTKANNSYSWAKILISWSILTCIFSTKRRTGHQALVQNGSNLNWSFLPVRHGAARTFSKTVGSSATAALKLRQSFITSQQKSKATNLRGALMKGASTWATSKPGKLWPNRNHVCQASASEKPGPVLGPPAPSMSR